MWMRLPATVEEDTPAPELSEDPGSGPHTLQVGGQVPAAPLEGESASKCSKTQPTVSALRTHPENSPETHTKLTHRDVHHGVTEKDSC